ncbi:AraC family transcriptional regulator [uncultured Croceitalea sp.]|uniref:AraC family transcriptional regulator n=1 Tax=uncultured Croceitalea sp. TaxID=1798908 RepID=UPI003305663F
MQYPPSHNLSRYIKHYLVFRITNNDKKHYRHFANGHSGLVFTFNKKELVSLYSKNSLPASFVFGQVSEYQDFFVDGSTSVVIVLLQPLGLFALTGIRSSTFTNRIEEASLILGKEISGLHERLFFSSNAIEMIGLLNSFFVEKFDGLACDHNPYVSSFISLALQKKGNVLVKDVCSQLGLNERKVQRLFSEQIGITPKKLLNNIRLHFFIGLTKHRDQNSLTNIGLEAGYYDQAHLIREFKKTVGFNPSTYLKTNRLAVNLIQI